MVEGKEIWVDLEESCGQHSVSSKGRIYSKKYSRILKGCPNQKGYLSLDLRRGKAWGNAGTPSIHSLVAKYFIGPRPDGYQINHKDGNVKNNSVTNLEYVTGLENMRHSYDSGLRNTAFSDAQVLAILNEVKTGKTYVEIAKMFNTQGSSVSDIIRGRRYSRVSKIAPTKTGPRQGEVTRAAKITAADVLEIRGLAGIVTNSKLAERFKVSRSTICDIQKRRSWKHVK